MSLWGQGDCKGSNGGRELLLWVQHAEGTQEFGRQKLGDELPLSAAVGDAGTDGCT